MNDTSHDQEPAVVPSRPDDQHHATDAAPKAKYGSAEDGRSMTDADQALENQKEMLDSGEENPG